MRFSLAGVGFLIAVSNAHTPDLHLIAYTPVRVIERQLWSVVWSGLRASFFIVPCRRDATERIAITSARDELDVLNGDATITNSDS